MPLAAAIHSHSVIAPWLDGLLPDDHTVRRAWGRRFQVPASSPFALLATPVGEEALAARGRVTWLSDADVEERIAALSSAGAA